MENNNEVVLQNLISLLSVNFENLLNLPAYVFWKNKTGSYLGYNDYGAMKLGYKSCSEMIGKTDFELFPKAVAQGYRANDEIVLADKKQVFVLEEGVLKDKAPVIFLSYKMPLYDPHKEIVGIAGISFTRPSCDMDTAFIKNVSVTDLAQACNYCPQSSGAACSIFSEKERLCLRYLCQGLTFKMIARQLAISPKTVETYVERAKLKINCHGKAQLVAAFMKMCRCISQGEQGEL